MDCDVARLPVELDRPPKASDRQGLARECQYSRGSERNHNTWMDQFQLPSKPPAIVTDLAGGGLLVKPPLAAFLKLEMLDGVREIRALAVNACFLKSSIEKPPGGADEGTTLHIFLVARLFANQGDTCADRPLAQYSSCRSRDEGLG